jgi:hypothetical protein
VHITPDSLSQKARPPRSVLCIRNAVGRSPWNRVSTMRQSPRGNGAEAHTSPVGSAVTGPSRHGPGQPPPLRIGPTWRAGAVEPARQAHPAAALLRPEGEDTCPRPTRSSSIPPAPTGMRNTTPCRHIAAGTHPHQQRSPGTPRAVAPDVRVRVNMAKARVTRSMPVRSNRWSRGTKRCVVREGSAIGCCTSLSGYSGVRPSGLGCR